MGRHMGHTFVYLQDAVQDCRAITIQLLADAQQGRQAVQVRAQTCLLGIERKKSPQVIYLCHLFIYCLFYFSDKGGKYRSFETTSS